MLIYFPDLLSTKPKARSGQLIKLNFTFYYIVLEEWSIVISARCGVCNSFFTKSFSGIFPFCLIVSSRRSSSSIDHVRLNTSQGLIEEQENGKVSFLRFLL